MNPVIARITIRQLLSRRRVLLLVLLGAVLVLVAVVHRVSGTAPSSRFTADLLGNVGIAVLMPIVALIFGTGALGSELEDGTAIYVLAKPVPRASVGATKLVVAIGCSVILTCVPIAVAALIAGGEQVGGLVGGFTLGAAIGSAVYCAIFLALSLVTGRAFVFGLAYVLVWEGFLAGLFAGTRTLSVRQQTLAFAQAIGGLPADVLKVDLATGTAIAVATVVSALAIVVALRRLARIEIAGELS